MSEGSKLYSINGNKYYRVTGVCSAGECEAVGNCIVNQVDTNLVANAITLPGTLMHWKIEKYNREIKDVEPPQPIRWSKGALQILDSWEKEGTIQERFYMPADEGFEGFLQFIRDLEHIDETGQKKSGIDPILIEHTMYVDNFADTGIPVAGTVDLIARVWLKGQIESDGYFYRCTHHAPYDPLCKCSFMWVVTVMDWKYSTVKQSSHPEQLSAYHYMGGVTNAFNIASENGRFPINHDNWSLLFKRPNHEIGYRLEYYSQDLKPFLEVLEIMRDPKPITRNRRNYTLGLHGRCMFCTYQNHCPDRRTVDEDQTVRMERDDITEAKYGVDV